MLRYGLVGHNISHTISPYIHSLLFEIDNVEAKYEIYDIAPDELKSKINQLKELDGFNVTIPYKTEITKYIDKLSRNSFLSSSVNNVKNVYSKSFGFTTDAESFSLIAERENFPLDGDIVILGCGGVARAIALACIGNESRSITMAVREQSVSKCKDLIEEFDHKLQYKINMTDINDIKGNIDVLVNGTPVGMFPDTDSIPVSEDVIKRSHSVFDTIYNPVKTKLYKKAEELNIKVNGGIEMLVYQAALSHTAWLDKYYTDEQLLEIIKLAEREIDRVYG